ncbi:MAG: type VI secretion system accessory protein TagJ, partial [Desulfobacterales bacterium]
ANGGESVGLIPTRYPGSEQSGDPEVRRGRKTEWLAQPGGGYIGEGQRMFFTDAGEYALMEVRRIDLNTGTDEAEAGTASGEAIG